MGNNMNNWNVLNGVNVPQRSSEYDGVRCFYCNVQLPRNNWKFDHVLGLFCFYDIAEGGHMSGFSLASGGASASCAISPGTKLYKYFRREPHWIYKCASCFAKTQTKDTCRSLDLQLQGKGMIVFPQEWGQTKVPNQITLTSLEYGTRLSAHPDGKVDMNHNNQFWQQWVFEHIEQDKYHLKSKTHGTHLRGYPDGHLEVVNDKSGWETWIKRDYGAHQTWKSQHGNYLSCNQDGQVFLSPHQSKNEFWIDI